MVHAYHALQEAKIAALFQAIVEALGLFEVLDFAPGGVEGGQVENGVEMGANLGICHSMLNAGHTLFDNGEDTSKRTVGNVGKVSLAGKVELECLPDAYLLSHKRLPSSLFRHDRLPR